MVHAGDLPAKAGFVRALWPSITITHALAMLPRRLLGNIFLSSIELKTAQSQLEKIRLSPPLKEVGKLGQVVGMLLPRALSEPP
jgi:hypothetical protein